MASSSTRGAMSTPVMHGVENRKLDIAWVREQFPSLKLQISGQPAAFLDGPAGTQVPRQVMDAVQNYFDDLRRKITPRTKVVAVGYASNIVGTINPVAEITKLAHSAGALMFIDAVHYAPHGLIDVQGINCDFLVCSPYKFFGPHLGTLYGKREQLQRFKPYKVRPAYDTAPDRWETGTQVQELIAGIGAAVDYIAELGRRSDPTAKTRREALRAAYLTTVPYERTLLTQLLEGLARIPSVKVLGITAPARFKERCSTISLRIDDHHPTQIAQFLGDRGIFTWDGNFYALNLSERLGLEDKGGVLRIGLVHYNTAEEVDRLLRALSEFVARR
jgi:cysteine desulfurase family protein (TIGR01976 family)